MVQRLSEAGAPSAGALAREVGVSQSTLSRWLRSSARVSQIQEGAMSREPGHSQPPPQPARSSTEKVRIVWEAARLSDAELGEFLRREGLHEQDLASLKEEVFNAAIKGLTPQNHTNKQRSAESRREQKEIQRLKRELRRKEAALAETAALLVLRKKAAALWGEEGDDT